MSNAMATHHKGHLKVTIIGVGTKCVKMLGAYPLYVFASEAFVLLTGDVPYGGPKSWKLVDFCPERRVLEVSLLV